MIISSCGSHGQSCPINYPTMEKFRPHLIVHLFFNSYTRNNNILFWQMAVVVIQKVLFFPSFLPNSLLPSSPVPPFLPSSLSFSPSFHPSFFLCSSLSSFSLLCQMDVVHPVMDAGSPHSKIPVPCLPGLQILLSSRFRSDSNHGRVHCFSRAGVITEHIAVRPLCKSKKLCRGAEVWTEALRETDGCIEETVYVAES